MKRPFLLASLAAPLFLSAQSFAPPGATWTYTYAVDNIIDPFPPVYSAYMLTAMGDTLLGGHLCSRVEGSGLACHNNLGFLYQSNDSVFQWDAVAGAFGLLYRWDAVTGESWNVPIHGAGFGADTLTYTVLSTSTTMINSQSRRVLDVQIWDQLSYSFSGGQLIEGIGDIGYLFPWYIGLCDGFTMGPLRCYEDADLGLYMAPGITQCDLGTFVPANPGGAGLTLSPTITERGGIVTVTVADPACRSISVLDALGREVLRRPIAGGKAVFQMDQAGVYSVRAWGSGSNFIGRTVVR